MKCLIILVFAYIFTCVYPHEHNSTNSSTLFEALDVKLESGYLYPPSNISAESDENPQIPVHIPPGKTNTTHSPTTSQSHVAAFGNASTPSTSKRWCGDGPVQFQQITEFGMDSGFPPDMSGATDGKVVFATSNTFASFSTNRGSPGTFINIPNIAIFSGPANPPIHNGVCCDQVVLYIPKIKRFVWLMQYSRSSSNTNMLRLIIFKPRDVGGPNGIRKWSTINLTSDTFNLGNNWMDYPDMSHGNKFLYISVDAVGSGLFVVRIPFEMLLGKPSPPIEYTPTFLDAYGAHITQRTRDAVFWAGQPTLDTLRVYKIPENSHMWFSSVVAINAWSNADYTSFCPDGANWLDFRFPGSAVIGATRQSRDEVWFAWGAGRTPAFPNPYVEVVQVSVSSFPLLSVNRQWEIWNPGYSYAYPYLTTNECGVVGISLGWGGDSTFASSAVGIADAQTGIPGRTLYSTSVSNGCASRWGDYVTVRPAPPDEHRFGAFVYSLINSSVFRQYVAFGR
jgi:hypothetical protein